MDQGNKNTNIIQSEMIEIGGIEQYLMVSGYDRNKPLILFLHGGPGVPLSLLRPYFPEEIEKNFMVAHWDQRGAGKSYSDDIPADSMNVEQLIADTLEMVDYLRKYYGKQKIYLCGISWGTILGIHAVDRYPEKFHAYIGMSQVVDIERGEKISYDYLLEEVKKQDIREAIEELVEIGKPPYKNSEQLMTQRKWLHKLGLSERKINSNELFSKSCSPEELKKVGKGVSFSEEHLNSEILNYNIDIEKIDIPVYLCMGKYDYQTPSIIAKEFCAKLKAPRKEFIWFEESAHSTMLEEPDKFLEVLLRVLDETS